MHQLEASEAYYAWSNHILYNQIQDVPYGNRTLDSTTEIGSNILYHVHAELHMCDQKS